MSYEISLFRYSINIGIRNELRNVAVSTFPKHSGCSLYFGFHPIKMRINAHFSKVLVSVSGSRWSQRKEEQKINSSFNFLASCNNPGWCCSRLLELRPWFEFFVFVSRLKLFSNPDEHVVVDSFFSFSVVPLPPLGSSSAYSVIMGWLLVGLRIGLKTFGMIFRWNCFDRRKFGLKWSVGTRRTRLLGDDLVMDYCFWFVGVKVSGKDIETSWVPEHGRQTWYTCLCYPDHYCKLGKYK